MAGSAGAAANLVDVSGSLAGFRRPIGGPDNAGGLAGAAWFDYNNSGRLSLFIPGTPGHPNALFENLGGGRFVDVAAQAGVAGGLGGGGVAVADINNDGCQDLLISGTGGIETGQESPTKLYLNNCDGTFTDITTSSGIVGTKTTTAVAFADINNDGYVDILLGSFGDFKNQKQPDKLYLNNGNNTFTDITASSGIAQNVGTVAVGFTDFNNDGRPDIIAVDGNNGAVQPLKGGEPPMFQPVPGPIHLYRNNGNNTFTDVAAQAGLGSALGFWMSVTLGDIYNHGNLDLFSTNAGHSPGGLPLEELQPLQVYFPHGLWENTSNPLAALTSPFVPGTVGLTPDPTGGLLSPLGGPLPGALGNATSGVADALAPALKPLGTPLGGVFYKNVSQAAGLSNLAWGWGASFADFTNSGHEDLFFNGTYPGLGGLIHSAPFIGDRYGNPGYLLHNDGTGKFTIAQTFAQQNRFTSGSAVGDYDNDGRPDIAIVNTAYGSDPGAPILLHNETVNNNGWITVKLVGTKSNRDGIGAKAWVLDGPLTKLQEVRSGTGFASQDSLWLTFGLGPNTPATIPVEVAWPSGLLETFNASTGRNVTLTEGTGTPTTG